MICRDDDMKGGLSGHLFLWVLWEFWNLPKTVVHGSCDTGTPVVFLCATALERSVHTTHCVGQSVGLWPTETSEAVFSKHGRK